MAHRINADWDDAAGIWIATSTEVQGLWTEAVSLEALIAIVVDLVPELLVANGVGNLETTFGGKDCDRN